MVALTLGCCCLSLCCVAIIRRKHQTRREVTGLGATKRSGGQPQAQSDARGEVALVRSPSREALEAELEAMVHGTKSAPPSRSSKVTAAGGHQTVSTDTTAKAKR